MWRRFFKKTEVQIINGYSSASLAYLVIVSYFLRCHLKKTSFTKTNRYGTNIKLFL